MSTPLTDMVRKMMSDGCSPEIILTALEAAEVHARLPDAAMEKRRAWDRERKRLKKLSTGIPPETIPPEFHRNGSKNSTGIPPELGGKGGDLFSSLESPESDSEKKKTDSRPKTSRVTQPSGEIEEWTDKEIDEEFDDIWPDYPRRQGDNPKKPAKIKFRALVKQGISPFEIYNGMQRLAREVVKNGTEPRYVPQMITWLNQERWEDGQNQKQQHGVNGSGVTNGRGHG